MAMLHLYKAQKCPSCEHYHDLCSDDVGPALSFHRHDFICPITGKTTPFTPKTGAADVKNCPLDAVRMWLYQEPRKPNFSN
jgi:hypothetical protein